MNGLVGIIRIRGRTVRVSVEGNKLILYPMPTASAAITKPMWRPPCTQREPNDR
jgi:virulence-associated protein VagC